MRKLFLFLLCVVTVCLLVVGPAWPLADRRFDNAGFECPGTPEKHLCQVHFDALNWVSANGHFLAMGSDAHKAEINGNGNFQAVYYNNLNDNWSTVTATQRADEIHNWIVAQFPSGTPSWVELNEISASQWPGNATYRTWVINVVSRLKNTYSHSVILFSPFPAPGANDSSWQSLAGSSGVCAAIGIERYLSGQEINANGNSISWCQNLYQASKDAYVARGCVTSKLFLTEHFGHTLAGTAYGRAGASYAGWENAINARSIAARNVGFAGFCGYGWAQNKMLVSDTEMVHFIQYYSGYTLP